ncbi:fibrinogen-like protein A [Oculina patagonica]
MAYHSVGTIPSLRKIKITINGTKGQKGERGLPGKPQYGAFKFSDSAENCSLHTAGTVRYNTSQKALELCDGSTWFRLVTARKGHVDSNPGRHCLNILDSGQSRGSGLYWIDPNGGSTDDSFQAFCDMDTESGGWTLIATKVSPNFLFIKTSFSTMAAKTKYADAASHIHPDMRDWEEAMFRFADVNTIRVIYNRKAGAPKNGKTEFEKFLMGTYANMGKNEYGFFKYSPADKNQRNPAVGFATISPFYFRSKEGISELHAGTDKWLDMWYTADPTNNYVTSDDSKARGTKCIAGYCYLNKPIWVMVR